MAKNFRHVLTTGLQRTRPWNVQQNQQPRSPKKKKKKISGHKRCSLQNQTRTLSSVETTLLCSWWRWVPVCNNDGNVVTTLRRCSASERPCQWRNILCHLQVTFPLCVEGDGRDGGDDDGHAQSDGHDEHDDVFRAVQLPLVLVFLILVGARVTPTLRPPTWLRPRRLRFLPLPLPLTKQRNVQNENAKYTSTTSQSWGMFCLSRRLTCGRYVSVHLHVVLCLYKQKLCANHFNKRNFIRLMCNIIIFCALQL